MNTRYESKRFKFDVENYLAATTNRPMKHIRVYCEGAMQLDLWLDEDDISALNEAVTDNTLQAAE
jgi:hypothetical protein